MKPNTHSLLLKGFQLFLENQKLENGYIKIKNQTIVEVGEVAELSLEDKSEYEVIEFPLHYHAIPGFIDLHIHGVDGADTMDGTKEALDTMGAALPREGTTSFLATTMTQEIDTIEKALSNAGTYIDCQQTQGAAELLGIHLEGPFVNKKKAGAQPLQHIIHPNLTLFQKWQSLASGAIKLVTLAPELPGGLEMIQYLKHNGIVASIGHTDATYEEAVEAINAGVNHATHLYNQMSGLHHRQPGVVGAALLRNEIIAEIIVDGIHVRPEMVELAFRQKHREGLILITDSMRAKCLKNGRYDLGGQEVTVQDGKAYLEDGTLAGSILKMGEAAKNIVAFTKCTIEDVIEMTSVNPAKQLNIFHRKGSLAQGKDADIVILDEQLNVFMTVCRGSIAFNREVISS